MHHPRDKGSRQRLGCSQTLATGRWVTKVEFGEPYHFSQNKPSLGWCIKFAQRDYHKLKKKLFKAKAI
jgi:hypothetical protein